jgi:hypothetical protein
MAGQAQQPPLRRDEIAFPPNTPITVSLKYGMPKMVSGRAGERALFTLEEPAGFVMFLDPPVAGQISTLGINVREPFTITRRESGRKGEPAQWQVARIAAPAPPLGQQPDGTYAIPRDPEASPEAASTAACGDRVAPKPPMRAGSLVEAANDLVDAYAVVLHRALTTYEGRIKPDEVRALLITAHISRSKQVA